LLLRPFWVSVDFPTPLNRAPTPFNGVRIDRFLDPDPAAAAYPVLIAASSRCPPEDVGGFPDYEEFLAAITDPDHERHEEINEWRHADFDPTTAPVDDRKSGVAALARQWNRKPRCRKSA